MANKAELRKHIRGLKGMLSEAEKQRQADSVFHDIECLQQFHKSNVVLLYNSLPDELPTHKILDKWSCYKTILLPRVEGDSLRLYQYVPGKLEYGSFNIAEPNQSCEEFAISQVDIVIIPAMAFDRHGHRLGRGKGFYDRLLKDSSVTKIGVSFNCQILKNIPVDNNDVNMDIVMSDSNIFFID